MAGLNAILLTQVPSVTAVFIVQFIDGLRSLLVLNVLFGAMAGYLGAMVQDATDQYSTHDSTG